MGRGTGPDAVLTNARPGGNPKVAAPRLAPVRRQQPLRATRLVVVAVATTFTIAVAGCAPAGDPAPTASATASAATPAASSPVASPTPTATASGADGRLADFRATVQSVWDDSRSVAGRDYVDALIAAGFAKADMQVTFDETSVGDPADSIQFAVRVADDCLIGQVGPSVSRPTALVMPGLSDGTCLLGETRPIDW